MSAPDYLRLHQLADQAWTLDLPAFRQICGPAFLLRRGVAPTRAEMETTKRTSLVSRTPLRPGTLPGDDALVYTLRAPHEGAGITVGRSRKNDIVIRDSSISGAHAIIRAAGGAWTVADVGSSNGTYVEDHPAATKESHAWTELTAGARVRLGAVSMTFLDAAELVRLVRRLVPRTQVDGR
jgi:hypothetical protein